VTLNGVKDSSTVHFRLGGVAAESAITPSQSVFTFRGLHLPAGDGRFEAWVERVGESLGVWDVEVRRVD
jgi:hypothetical protein